MSDKQVKALVEILEDPFNATLTVAEVALKLLEKIEELENESHKIAVVGQILVEGSEKPRIVVLGPFGARGKLETEEAWNKAAESHTGSRSEGGKLAFRSTASPSTARGRFLLAPVFSTASKAWKFFPDKPVEMEEIEEEFRSIRGTNSAMLAGPACLCGFKSAHCQRHPNGREK